MDKGRPNLIGAINHKRKMIFYQPISIKANWDLMPFHFGHSPPSPTQALVQQRHPQQPRTFSLLYTNSVAGYSMVLTEPKLVA